MNNPAQLAKDFEAPKDNTTVEGWFSANVNEERPHVLAFLDDGIVWGKWTKDGLLTSHDVAPSQVPVLRGETLQQAYIFGKKDELRLFRDNNGDWHCRQIMDGDPKNFVVEYQILWGNKFGQKLGQEFSQIWDSGQKVAPQIVPVVFENDEFDPKTNDLKVALRLKIHHFITEDPDTGEARVYLSRLVQLGVGPLAEEMMK